MAASSKPLVNFLESLKPSRLDTRLLQASLWERPQADLAWQQWLAEVGQPKAFFQNNSQGKKGLLPFLGYRSGLAMGFDVDSDFATYLRVAQVREDLRNGLFMGLLKDILGRLAERHVRPVLVNGAGYALSVYANPNCRHNHGIDFLVRPRQLRVADQTARELGFRAVGRNQRFHRSPRTYQHHNGLALTLRTCLFSIPHAPTARGYWQRTRRIDVGGIDVNILGAADMLCHTLTEAAAAPNRANLRWAVDTFELLKCSGSQLCKQLVTSSPNESLVTWPVPVLLDYFRTQLNSPVDESDVQTLFELEPLRTREATTLALSTALRTNGNKSQLLSCGRDDWGTMLNAARFALMPSVQHMLHKYNESNLLRLPLLYLDRSSRGVMRPFTRRMRGGKPGQTVPSGQDSQLKLRTNQ